ncbi:hypothetical protein [Paenibacillus graminis]|nr:hypothetical protein [Paenibacillus graminis]
MAEEKSGTAGAVERLERQERGRPPECFPQENCTGSSGSLRI